MTHIARNFKKFIKKRVCTNENKESNAKKFNKDIDNYKV